MNMDVQPKSLSCLTLNGMYRGSHHFVGLAGDPVGVAQDFQLHVRLGHAAANQSQMSGPPIKKNLLGCPKKTLMI